MLYSDSALEQLRTCLTNNGYPFEMNQLDEKIVRLNVKISDYIIPVWFLVDKQIFGFDMINGGSKTCSSIEDFNKYFTTYIHINVDFIPKAKIIADVFEKDLGVNSVYDTFSGNKEEGYVAKFRILSIPGQYFLVSQDTTLYVARLVTYSEDGSRFKVLKEYKYDLDDVGNVTNIPTIHSYLAKLTELYGESDTVDIDRVGINSFVFNIEGLNIKADVVFSYTEISYDIKSVNGVEFNQFITPEDPYELQALYLECHDAYEAKLIDVEEEPVSNGVEDEQGLEDEQSLDEVQETEKQGAEEQETEEQLPNEEQLAEEVPTEEEIPVEREPQIEETALDNEDIGQVTSEDSSFDETSEQQEMNLEEEQTLESNDFSVKKVIGSDNKDAGLQFVVDGSIYFINAETAVNLGVPLARFSEIVGTKEKHGVVMTTDEIDLHTFSKDVSSDAEQCKKLIFRIFE